MIQYREYLKTWISNGLNVATKAGCFKQLLILVWFETTPESYYLLESALTPSHGETDNLTWD